VLKFIKKSIMASLVIALFQSAHAQETITREQLIDKCHGMWLGQMIGNYTGRNTDGLYAGDTPNPAANIPWDIQLEWRADCVTDVEYIAIDTLKTYGFGCTPAEIAAQWQTHITSSGIYIANKQARFLMDDGFLPSDTGSRNYNLHWYSIDSQITTEVLGTVCPGMPQQAIDLTKKFAAVSNEGFATHTAQFYAAIISHAFFESDINVLIDNGLEAIPQTSRTHEVISDVKAWYAEDIQDQDPNWIATRKKLYDNYQGSLSNGRNYSWVESTINTGATVLALLYGQGDFKETTQIATLAGWNCDCNPATAAAIIGTIDGYSGLPSDLTDSAICGDTYKNIYRPFLPDHSESELPQEDTITNIASMIADLAIQNILDNGGVKISDDPNTYEIPDPSAQLITDPEKTDPTGPSGLVADAITDGITVIPTASVQNYESDDDRKNLNSIIDGITDNSYNGHRPYYTYLYDPASRPEQDFYQLNFSEHVHFTEITFYEGDNDWQGINNYITVDDLYGGYFEDLTVEILKAGKWVTPTNIQMSEDLDKLKMYQEITFTFDPDYGTAIRIIGTPGGTKSFTTIMELQAQGHTIESLGLYKLNQLASYWLTAPDDPSMDINDDGIINLVEFDALVSEFNVADRENLLSISNYWLSAPDNPTMDIDDNGIINLVEFSDLASKWMLQE